MTKGGKETEIGGVRLPSRNNLAGRPQGLSFFKLIVNEFEKKQNCGMKEIGLRKIRNKRPNERIKNRG